MPKIKWMNPVPPEDYVKSLFNRHKKACGYTSDALGEVLGKKGGAVRAQLYRGCEGWSLSEIRAWCIALNVSAEEIGKAILRE